jgi:FtsP/CotA-like multicopper oxidase with cupredoxin domain
VIVALLLIRPLDYFVLAWLCAALASTLWVARDQFARNPEPTVMRWGFILVTLYGGPLALLVYVLADKEPRPGTHERFIEPLWKQGIGSTVHCIAGDSTGIILAAVITASLGLPMWLDLIVEYLSGFAFGLFIFQALFMKNMMGGSYWENVRRSILPEFISMNFMMAGMAPTMSLLMMGRDMRAMDPLQLLFWGVMSLGVIVGFVVAYPANVWMVGKGIKHGLMTERPPGSRFADEAPKKGSEQAGQSGSKEGKPRRDEPTTPQLAAVGLVSVVALATGMVAPANWVNLRLGADDVGDSIMPPGVISTPDTSGQAMQDMAAVLPVPGESMRDLHAHGDTELAPRIEAGVKVFTLDAAIVRWTILPGVTVDAYAFNGQVPGPRIRVRQGDRVRIDVTNHLPETTTTHWHGLVLPNPMDGVARMTQDPIASGGTFHYAFTATQAGTFFYHSHDHVDRQQALGLYGALIIDPADPADDVPADVESVVQVQEWLVRDGLTYPAMPMEGALPNYFTINGRSWPSTDVIHLRVGQKLKVRFIGAGTTAVHPMHIHGGPFTVVARDGVNLPVSARYQADTINLGPGQRYDVVWPAREPGKWMLHCHITHHTTNDGVEVDGGGGLMMTIDVAP